VPFDSLLRERLRPPRRPRRRRVPEEPSDSGALPSATGSAPSVTVARPSLESAGSGSAAGVDSPAPSASPPPFVVIKLAYAAVRLTSSIRTSFLSPTNGPPPD